VLDLITNLQRKLFLFAKTLQTLEYQMQVWCENGYGFFKPGLKTGVENGIFGSEIGSGFVRHTPTKNSKEYPSGAGIPERFRPWRPCWITGKIKLIAILLLMVIQHGGDDVSWKQSINKN